jgi:hypothetical protein
MNLWKKPIRKNESCWQHTKRHIWEMFNDIWCVLQATFWSTLLLYPVLLIMYWLRPEATLALMKLLIEGK